MTTFYLASTSPARRMLLEQAGIEATSLSPGVDEDAAVAEAERSAGQALSPEETVLLLARAKAEAGAAALRERGAVEGLVFGGDSVFALDGVVYGKPHTAQEAERRWSLQRGRTGVLHSGHHLVDLATGRSASAAASAEVSFVADLTDAEIDAYIATGEPLLVAGAFTIDSLGAPFIERVVGDPSTVVGMSLPTLRRLSRELGHEWTSLWSGGAAPLD